LTTYQPPMQYFTNTMLMKSPPVIIGIIICVLLIVAGISYFTLIRPSLPEASSQVAPPTEQPAPSATMALSRESKPPPEMLLSFEQKIESLGKATADVCATGESKEITLTFTEIEANNQATRLLATAEIPTDIPLEIESVHIDFQPDNIILTEARSVIYDRFRATIKAKAQVSIEAGKPKVEITKVNFGFIPLPRLLKDTIVELITAEIDDFQSQLTQVKTGCNGSVRLEFTEISIQEEEITIALIIKRVSHTNSQ